MFAWRKEILKKINGDKIKIFFFGVQVKLFVRGDK